MSAGPKDSRLAKTPVVVPTGGRFEGLLAFRDQARIDGEVTGRITGPGRLEIGDAAFVSGPIEVDELVSWGRIDGDVEIRERIELGEGATLSGSLRTQRLAVASGAVIQGRCSVAEHSK